LPALGATVFLFRLISLQGTHTETSVPEVVESLTSAARVLIVPGYGLAVANAQHSIAELTKKLKAKGVQVRGND
jgi:NAD/NADP transhydrogenase beta subunit